MAKKVSIVEHEKDADYKVYFCDEEHQQKNHELIAGAKLVLKKERADVKVIIVEHEHRANIHIMRKNFPT
jgi:hypothetical protein